MYYPCSENKGADQLRGYREADLRLCFRIGNNPVFSRCGSNGFRLFRVFPCGFKGDQCPTIGNLKRTLLSTVETLGDNYGTLGSELFWGIHCPISGEFWESLNAKRGQNAHAYLCVREETYISKRLGWTGLTFWLGKKSKNYSQDNAFTFT